MILPIRFSVPRCVWSAIVVSAATGWAASFPKPFDTEQTPGGPMPAAESAAKVTLPPGFRATLFAGEPDVAQPIAIATDARGRLWVAENYTYSERTVGFHAELRDRIVIFEDTDNDGRHDKRTVFWDGAQRLTSIELGLGGVWAICVPQLLFIPDRDGDDRPDGAPEVRLDGFEFERARHNVANGLRWGPDGWLYGRHGILGTSLVGTPGTPAAQRTSVNVGVWRYHPQRRAFEIVVEGTTNPWGMDWDQHGEGFFINTVIGHLWQLIPGAHYRRMSGPPRNPRAYEVIEQHADHVHWAENEVWTDVRKGVTATTSERGGGHAHTGLLIYQGGQWPAEWRGKLLTLNYHGRRVNVERLVPHGSAIIGRGEPDAFHFADPWFRGIDLIAAPDGGVFIADWSDAGECHDNDGIHRSSGRIFKLIHGPDAPRREGDLSRLDGATLARLQTSDNDWLARQARRVLADRAATGVSLADAVSVLQPMITGDFPAVHRLRALWSMRVMGRATHALLDVLLEDRDAHVRRWAVRLLVDDRSHVPESGIGNRLAVLAANEPDASVRLALASALQRLPTEAAAKLAAPLVRRAEDARDHNLPLMLWYGVAPLANAPGGVLENLASSARIPTVARLAARRLTEEITTAPARIDALLAGAAKAPAEIRAAVLDGIAQGLAGRRDATPPAGWATHREAYSAAAPKRFRELGARFGDATALAELRTAALDAALPANERRAALAVLTETRAPALREVCEQLLGTPALTAPSAAGLGTFDDPVVADRLLAAWPRIAAVDRAAVVGVLASRVAWAGKLIDALAAGRVERAHIGAYHARQMRFLGDAALAQRVESVWGRPPAEVSGREERAQMTLWKNRLTPAVLAEVDRANGRVLFQARCASCHVLNGSGGAIGPDLTGAARDNLAYLLENIIAPSAIVPDAYRMVAFTLKDGRTVAGMVRERTPAAVKVQTMTDAVVVATADIAREESSATSLMPPGLIDGLGVPQVRDLLGYMMHRD
ncbi:MAG: c-type cytochrome [Opitutaceae bacterium]|nr:c-type cytochrome [Opitutaceae bacterium]